MTILPLLQIKPLVGPTKSIMDFHIKNYKWHEFFPNGKDMILIIYNNFPITVKLYLFNLFFEAKSRIGLYN